MVYRHLNSSNWNEFEFRDGDIVVASYAKSGTTWVQQIVRQLLFDGADDLPLDLFSPWIDTGFVPTGEVLRVAAAQRHRRCLKTHLPVDALPFSPRAKYLYIGRDGRDVVWSLFNHFARANDYFYGLANHGAGKSGPLFERPTDVRKWYHEWLDRDGFPVHPFWSHVQSWWDIRSLANVKLLHFNRLKANLAAEMAAIAAFLGIEVDGNRWPVLVHHCTFDYMKSNADRLTPLNGMGWDGGGRAFIHKGTNGRWRSVLQPAEIRKYERLAARNLAPACAHWLATGESGELTPAGAPELASA